MISCGPAFFRSAVADGIDRAPHNMTGASTPTPFVVSASSQYTSLEAYKAFDGAFGTGSYWITNGIPTGWLKIDLGSAFLLRTYKVKVNTVPEPNRAPKDWTLEGSNDGSTWNVLSTVTNQTAWGNGEARTFTCSVTTTSYRYFRLNVSANNGDSYLQTAELYLYT